MLLNRIRCFDNLCEALFTIHSGGNINVVSSMGGYYMRLLLSTIVTAGSLILAIAAFAQSATTTPAASVPVNPASAASVASGKGSVGEIVALVVVHDRTEVV